MSNAWLTPNTQPTGTKQITLDIPDDPDFEAIFKGCLVLLIHSENFEQFGSVTPEETARFFLEALIDYIAP